MKFGTLFSGGGGADLGLMAAGLSPAWAVEYDAKIAGVYADNIGHAPIVADVRGVDYAALPRVDWLHASPVCTRASVANSGAVETQEDIETAGAVVRAISAGSPRVVTIENVWQYRKFAAFGLICQALDRLGFFWSVDHVNAADFGVPQTRKRLILRAVHGSLLPPLPASVAWVGWLAAISDLLPDLPDSQLAAWQLARLPDEYRSLLFGNHPHTVSGARSKAVLLDGNNADTQKGAPIMRKADEAAFTVTGARSAVHRAILPSARVVGMTPRALARFQSFPDSYRLPASRTLAAKVIGNAVPPLMVQRLAEDMLRVL